MLDGSIYEPLDLGERYDVVEFAADLRSLHPENGAVEVYVLASCQLVVKPGSHFQKGANAAVNLPISFAGLGDAGQNLQEGALPGTVAPDDADDFAASDF